MPTLRRMLSSFLGALLPQNCCVCGACGSESIVCGECRQDLPYWNGAQACPVCAQWTAAGEVCGQCLGEPPAFDRVAAVFDYAFPVNRLVQALKYRHRLALAGYFAGMIAGKGIHIDADVIVPMPLHARRLRQRGFNQAVELARPLGRALKRPLVLHGVVRHKAALPQEGLSRAERRRNVRGVFSCRDSFEEKSVLVIDDVMTTGATLDALAAELKRHGARRVEALMLARTMHFH